MYSWRYFIPVAWRNFYAPSFCHVSTPHLTRKHSCHLPQETQVYPLQFLQHLFHQALYFRPKKKHCLYHREVELCCIYWFFSLPPEQLPQAPPKLSHPTNVLTNRRSVLVSPVYDMPQILEGIHPLKTFGYIFPHEAECCPHTRLIYLHIPSPQPHLHITVASCHLAVPDDPPCWHVYSTHVTAGQSLPSLLDHRYPRPGICPN